MVQRLVVRLATPKGEQQYRELSGSGNDGFLFGSASAFGCEFLAVSFQVTVRAEGTEDVVGGAD